MQDSTQSKAETQFRLNPLLDLAVAVAEMQLKAWQAYQSSPEYLNSWTWAGEIKHRDGSMWAAFVQGWNAAQQHRPPSASHEGEKDL